MPKLFHGQSIGFALVAQWIEHLTTDQKVGGSSPFERASGPARCVPPVGALLYPSIPPWRVDLGLKDEKSWSEPDLSALWCGKVWFKVVGGQL